LQWMPTDERDKGEVWLTKPKQNEEPNFLEALMTFNYVGKDVGHGENYFKGIDYEAVRQTLEQRQREDMAKRHAAGTLGESDPAIKEWLTSQKVPDDDPVWTWVARHDRLSEMEEGILASLPGLGAQLEASPDLQQDYDLMSVFVLILRDELEKLKRRIRSRAPRDSRPVPQAPSSSSKKKGKSIWRNF